MLTSNAQLSDFLYLVPNIPHLRNLEIVVHYVELPQYEQDLFNYATYSPAKWKLDADSGGNDGRPPREKYFVNGLFLREKKDGKWKGSKTPFPESVVNPRRGGLQQVFPGDPDYLQLCKEQGITPVSSMVGNAAQRKSMTNGVYLKPESAGHHHAHAQQQQHSVGLSPEPRPSGDLNGGGGPADASVPHPRMVANGVVNVVNGVNGGSN